MPALADPKLEAFTQALLLALIDGLPRGKASEKASREAGYRAGSSFAANSRKRANREDVKARMIELAAPAQEQAEAEIAESCEAIRTRLYQIALEPLCADKIKPSDQIAASNLLAQMNGWMAPKKQEHSGPDGGAIPIERIERVIVDPAAPSVAPTDQSA